MKLSKAQQEVMDRAKKDISFARSHTVEEWAEEQIKYQFGCLNEAEKIEEEEIEKYARDYKNYYENEKAGIVLTQCNSRTIKKLEEFGLIQIMFDSNGCGSFNIDTIKVLNF